MKNFLIRSATLTLALAFLIALSSCTDSSNTQDTTGSTELTESTSSLSGGTAYYPPGEEPVERPHPRND